MNIKKRGLILILLLVIPIASAQYESAVSITENAGPDFVRTVGNYEVALTITTSPIGTRTTATLPIYETCIGLFCLPFAYSLFSINGWTQVYGDAYGASYRSRPYGLITKQNNLLLIEKWDAGDKKIGVRSYDVDASGKASASVKVNCAEGKINFDLYSGQTLLKSIASSSINTWETLSAENLDIAYNKINILLHIDAKGRCSVKEPMLVEGPFVFPYSSTLVDLEKKSCCPQEMCWDGLTCIQHKPNTEWTSIEDQNGMTYRCVDGQWQQNTIKYAWDNSLAGRCYDNSDCLVNKNIGTEDDRATVQALSDYIGTVTSAYSESITRTSPSIRCIPDKAYLADHSCSSGQWETRSKDLALTMLDVADRADLYADKEINLDYALFCDNYTNAINLFRYTGYFVDSQPFPESSIIGKKFGTSTITYSCILDENTGGQAGVSLPCANNFCILRYHDPLQNAERILLGASLNNQINKLPRPFLPVLEEQDLTACDNVNFNSDSYQQCSNLQIWYNPVKQNVIYVNDPSLSLTGPTLITLIKNPIDSIIQFVLNIWTPKPTYGIANQEYTFISQTKDFNKLYMEKTIITTVPVVKTITGFSEKKAEAPGRPVKEYMSIEFTNFADSNIINAVNAFAQKEGVDIDVTLNSGKQIIVTQDPKAIEKWTELTASLRIS